MNRVLVIGCSGSGKSTLSCKLGSKLEISVVHLDRLWWLPGWTNISQEAFDRKLAGELEKPRWIIDGNYSRTLPLRLQYCDAVVYLDYNRFTCLWGVLRRVIRYKGGSRPDMAPGCPERFNWEFMCWIWNFNKNNRERIYGMLSQSKGIEIVVLKNRRQAKRFLQDVVE